MPATIAKKVKIKKIDWKTDPNMQDYSKEPHFMRKNEEAAKFLLKNGLPKDIEKKIKK